MTCDKAIPPDGPRRTLSDGELVRSILLAVVAPTNALAALPHLSQMRSLPVVGQFEFA
jgi:hypothetical protein